MNKKNNIIELKKYKQKKKIKKNKRRFVILSVYLSIVSFLYASLYTVSPHTKLDIKSITDTHAFLYK